MKCNTKGCNNERDGYIFSNNTTRSVKCKKCREVKYGRSKKVKNKRTKAILKKFNNFNWDKHFQMKGVA